MHIRVPSHGLQLFRNLSPSAKAAVVGCLVFILLSIYSGSIFRNSFDDEIYTLLAIQRNSLVQLLQLMFSGGDTHPPLPHLIFKALWALWPSIYFLRCFSLICSAVCVYISIRILLDSFRPQTQVDAPWRIGAAVLIIATTPLVVAQGDSVRWYPMFAAVVFCAFRYEWSEKRWHSAVWSGIGFSTDFLGAPVYAGIVACRLWTYWKNGRLSPHIIATEIQYGICFGAFGILGFTNLVSLLIRLPARISDTQLVSPLTAIGQAPLGLIGGYSLGILAGLPVVAAYSTLLIYSLWRQRDQLARIMFILVSSIAPALIVFAGFSKSRSFLFLAIACSMVLSASILTATAKRALAIAGAVILIHMLVVVNRGGTVGIFKRNLAIPFSDISEFVKLNIPADGALITTEDVTAYTLRQEGRLSCVALSAHAPCLRDKHSVIVTLTGEPNLLRQTQILEFARSRCRREEASIPFGIDEEAVLKSKLTGSPLSRVILTGRLFKECD